MNFETDTTLIERTCKILNNNNFKKIIIVTGYKYLDIKKKLKNEKNIRFNYFRDYKKTNNLQTLLSIKSEIKNEFYCFFSDLVFDEEILKKLEKKKNDFCIVVDTSKSLKNTMRVKLKKKKIIDIGNHIKTNEANGNFIGIAKFSKKGSLLLKKNLVEERKNYKDYYTKAIEKIIKKGFEVNFFDSKSYFWKEIDTLSDYNELKKIIKKNKFKYD